MMPRLFGDWLIMEMPARYSSSAMKLSEMKKVMKFRKMNTFVEQSVDLCL